MKDLWIELKMISPLLRRLVMVAVILPGFVALPYSKKTEKVQATQSLVHYRSLHVQPPRF
jgi:hypothetical protein